MAANAVCKDVPGGKPVGRSLCDDSFFAEDQERQGCGVLSFRQGLAQQLSKLHRPHDWRSNDI